MKSTAVCMTCGNRVKCVCNEWEERFDDEFVNDNEFAFLERRSNDIEQPPEVTQVTPREVKEFIRIIIGEAVAEYRQRLLEGLEKQRKTKVTQMEGSTLVVDRMYHKGGVHFADSLRDLINGKE